MRQAGRAGIGRIKKKALSASNRPKPGAPLTRSQQMSRIRGRHTTPERILRELLWKSGLRYRLHCESMAGRPDIVFRRFRLTVFIDGCFFHGCPIHYVRPRSNAVFWSKKLSENVKRDRRQTLELEHQGWKVLRYWEHEVFESPDSIVSEIRSATEAIVAPQKHSLRVVRVDEVDRVLDTERRYLEDLRDPQVSETMVQVRSTRKWSRRKTGER